jgi:hypothetical protein
MPFAATIILVSLLPVVSFEGTEQFNGITLFDLVAMLADHVVQCRILAPMLFKSASVLPL